MKYLMTKQYTCSHFCVIIVYCCNIEAVGCIMRQFIHLPCSFPHDINWPLFSRIVWYIVVLICMLQTRSIWYLYSWMNYKLNSPLTSCINNVTLAQQLLLLQRSVALVAAIVKLTSARAIHVYNQENTNHIVCLFNNLTKCEWITGITLLSIPTFNSVSIVCC